MFAAAGLMLLATALGALPPVADVAASEPQDCLTWKLQPVPLAPSPRSFHAMASDASRGVTVIFGGSGSAGLLGDTWEWNGARWTQRIETAPSVVSQK